MHSWEQALYDEIRSLEIWVEAWQERHAEERKQPPYERAAILGDIDAILARLHYRCEKMRDRLDAFVPRADPMISTIGAFERGKLRQWKREAEAKYQLCDRFYRDPEIRGQVAEFVVRP